MEDFGQGLFTVQNAPDDFSLNKFSGDDLSRMNAAFTEIRYFLC